MTHRRPLDLSLLYHEARDAFGRLQAGRPRSDSETPASVRSMYETCASMISSAGIFSKNEDIEDLVTHDISKLACEYYMAELYLMERVHEPAERVETILKPAKALFTCYLDRLKQYGIADAEYGDDQPDSAAKYNEYVKLREGFSKRGGGESREAKIARHNMKSTLDKTIMDLEIGQREDSCGAAHDTPLKDEPCGELSRKLSIYRLLFFAIKTEEQLEYIDKEMRLLSARIGNDEGDESFRTSGKSQAPLNVTRISRPFTLYSSQRAAIQQGVFRSGHNLPTMTIDEYLEIERQRGNLITGGGPQSAQKEDDSDDETGADRKTMRAREFDEFKDLNRRGSGNTFNRA